MDSNHKENTEGGLSKWEFFNYLDYQEPSQIAYGDGYGDIDPFGADHKKFNKLQPMGEGTASVSPPQSSTQPVQSATQPVQGTTGGSASGASTSSQYTVDHCSSCDIYDLLQVGVPVPAEGVKVVNCCGKRFNATLAMPRAIPGHDIVADKLENEVAKERLQFAPEARADA